MSNTNSRAASVQLRVIYTVPDDPNLYLAKSISPNIPVLAFEANGAQYATIALKTCVQILTDASPELLNGADYTVYTSDPLEPTLSMGGLPVILGQGLLSQALWGPQSNSRTIVGSMMNGFSSKDALQVSLTLRQMVHCPPMLPPIQERSATTSKDDSHDSTLSNVPKGMTPIDLDGNATGRPTEDNLISFHDGNYAEECQDVADNADDILETNTTTSHHNDKRPDRLSYGNQAERGTKISQKDAYIPYARRPSSPLTEISSTNDNDPSPARIKNKRSAAGIGSTPSKASPRKDSKSSPQARKRKISLSRSPNSEHDKPPIKQRRGYRGVKVVYSSEAEMEREMELVKSPIKKKRARPRKVTVEVVSTPDSSGLGAQERAPNTSPAVTSNKATDDLLKNALSIFLHSAMQTIGTHIPQGSTINPSATALKTPNNSLVTTTLSSPAASLTAETETLSLPFPITSTIPPSRSALELLSEKSELVKSPEDTLAPIVNNSAGPSPNGEREMLQGIATFMATAGSNAADSTNNSHAGPPLTTPVTLDIATGETSRGRSQDLDELVYPF